jgi:hypothetical protein
MMSKEDDCHTRFSPKVSELLKESGWVDGENISIELSIPQELENDLFPAAQRILNEFYGLHIGDCGVGVNAATSDVVINPHLVSHVIQELRELGAKQNQRFFPLGEFHNHHWTLVVDDRGRIYLFNDELVRYAPSFERSLELLLLGKRPIESELESAWRDKA